MQYLLKRVRGKKEVLSQFHSPGSNFGLGVLPILVIFFQDPIWRYGLYALFGVLLGLFILAKNLGLITRIRPLIEELRRKKFRISEKIISEVLRKEGEEIL